jgi:hypothetical protein
MRELLAILATAVVAVLAVVFTAGVFLGLWTASWAMLRFRTRPIGAVDRALNREADKGDALLAFERSQGGLG